MVQNLDGFSLGDRIKVVSDNGDTLFHPRAVGEEGQIVVLDPSDNTALLILPAFADGFCLIESDAVTDERIDEGIFLGWFSREDIEESCCTWVSLSDLELICRKSKIQWIN